MSNHIYPQTDEVDKLRLDKIIQKAKDLDVRTKKDLFAKLESSLDLAFGDGNINFSDLSKLLSEAFTNFEQYLATLPDQDAAEGFLHWNHLIFYKHFLKLQPTDSAIDYLKDCLEESKYWLTDRLHNEGVLTKPFN